MDLLAPYPLLCTRCNDGVVRAGKCDRCSCEFCENLAWYRRRCWKHIIDFGKIFRILKYVRY